MAWKNISDNWHLFTYTSNAAYDSKVVALQSLTPSSTALSDELGGCLAQIVS
jgi:hypothetical protein